MNCLKSEYFGNIFKLTKTNNQNLAKNLHLKHHSEHLYQILVIKMRKMIIHMTTSTKLKS